MGGNLRVTSPQDFENQPLHGVGVECVAKSYHLVEDTAQGPDIRLLVVRLLLANLRRQVIWCSNSCLGTVIGVLEDTGNTEISDFNGAILIHKDVLGLQVNFGFMALKL